MKSMKKLEAEIDNIRFEPKSAMEFRDAKKEEQRMVQRQQDFDNDSLPNHKYMNIDESYIESYN